MATPLSFLTLADVCDRWGMKPLHVAACAIDGQLTLSVVLAGEMAELGALEEVRSGERQRMPEERQWLTGVFDLCRLDAWAIIAEGKRLVVDIEAGAGRYISLRPGGGVTVTVDDLLVRRSEVERFESERTAIDEPAREAGSRGGPGAPTRFDWEAFWIEVSRRVHDEGLPSTQAAMARDMLDWFTATGGAVPDHSTVKKKISRLWRALGRAETSRGRANAA